MIWGCWSPEFLNLYQAYSQIPVGLNLTAQNVFSQITGFSPMWLKGQEVSLEAPREEKEFPSFRIKEAEPWNARTIPGNRCDMSPFGTMEATVSMLQKGAISTQEMCEKLSVRWQEVPLFLMEEHNHGLPKGLCRREERKHKEHWPGSPMDLIWWLTVT